jgi:hypothetical protein
MPMPRDVKVVDLMMGIPVSEDNTEWYEAFKPLLMDEESRNMFKMPAQYMFKDIPRTGKREDYVRYVVEQMDRYNIEYALTGYFEGSENAKAARAQYPGRFIFD